VPIAEQIAIRLAGATSLDLIHAGQRLLEKDISADGEGSRSRTSRRSRAPAFRKVLTIN
jgi:hypothetical protein